MYHLIEHGIGLQPLTVMHKNMLAAANIQIISPAEGFVNPFREYSVKYSFLAIS